MDFKRIKDKIPIVRIIQRVVQLAAFILFPALFATVFTSLHNIFAALISGSFDAATLSRQLILASGVLVVTALMGRFFCSFICSFGAMQDLLWFIRKRFKIPQLKISEKTDKYLKLVKYGLLLFIIAFVWTGLAPINYLMDPWTMFGMYLTFRGFPSFTYLLSIGGALLLLIIIGSLIIERSFCRYLCPLGAVLAVVSRFRVFRIKKLSAHCDQCNACAAGCGMGVQLHDVKTIKSIECIDCFHCMQACPRSNLLANPKPAVATLMTVGVLTGVYYAGNLVRDAVITARQNQPITQPQTQNPGSQNPGVQSPGSQNPNRGQDIVISSIPDGIYKGSEGAFNGPVFVSVTVSNGAITKINIDGYTDDPEFFYSAESYVVPRIISTQSFNIDLVAGATVSSWAIIQAVINALTLG